MENECLLQQPEEEGHWIRSCNKKKENSVQASCIQNMNLTGNDHFYTTNAPQYLRAYPGQKEQGKELKGKEASKCKGNQGTDTGKYHS